MREPQPDSVAKQDTKAQSEQVQDKSASFLDSCSAERQEEIKRAWSNFFKTGDTGGEYVHPFILAGWDLSRKSGIDPISPAPPPVLGAKALARLRQKNAVLLEAAAPILQILAVSIRDTGYIATLAVPSGYLLEVVGDDDLMIEAHENYNIPGANLSVKTGGASALSMSISEKRPVIVTGYEHYISSFHFWRCAAAPVFDAKGEPIASLTISCHISRRDIHTLTLAQSCAQSIGIRLREIELINSQKRLNALLESVHNALPDAILAINREAVVTHANNRACALFRHIPELAGSNLDKMFGKPDMARVLNLLQNGTTSSVEMEVLTEEGASNRFCSFTPVLLDNDDLGGMIVSIRTKKQVIDLAKRVGGNYAKYSFEDIKGESQCLKEQIEIARKAALSAHRILLYGESGTGKELFAQSIHNGSNENNGPFVAISCAAIPRDLIESELFGYVGGAFTGARRDGMIGKMELASGGTLFLDEINSLPLELQAKLLRVLQQMEIVRLGDTKPTPINARIIAATNKDLREAVREGSFREDLYFRLNVIEIVIPPLRSRKDDISLLTHTFLRRQSGRNGTPFIQVTAEAMEAFYSYDWPGNVRELDNVCERALILSGNGIIEMKHLPAYLTAQTNGSQDTMTAGYVSGTDLNATYKQMILSAIKEHNGNMSKVADSLGIARSTLYRKMRFFGIGETAF